MANSIALAKTYLPLLDEVYSVASKTAILDSANTQVRFKGGNKIELFKTEMQGLGDYSRNTGFVDGDVTATWEELTLTKDRARSFSVDAMDDEETLGMAFGTLAGEFLRTKVVPEIDAYRFAKYCGFATSGNVVVKTSNALDDLETADAVMSDNEVPFEDRVCFVSETFYKGIKEKVTRSLSTETGVVREVLTLDGMPIIRVPSSRFYTGITLKSGSGADAAGGYVKAAGAKDIASLIVSKSAIAQVVKHEVPRIFDPNTNQKADAWKFDYRVYHDAFAMENKLNGIYVITET